MVTGIAEIVLVTLTCVGREIVDALEKYNVVDFSKLEVCYEATYRVQVLYM